MYSTLCAQFTGIAHIGTILRDAVLLAALACALPGAPAADTAGAYGPADQARLDLVAAYADRVLEAGRDRWSGHDTPLLADGVHVDTGEPVLWRHDGNAYIIHNLASQQNLFRALAGLSRLTGDARYVDATKAAIRYHFDHLASDCGLLRWGGHQIIDLRTLNPVGNFDANCHEFKNSFPYYDLMWEVDPDATAHFLRAFWNAHILDWTTLDINRHGRYGRSMGTLWDHAFDEPEPFFDGQGLTFINAGTDLIYAASMLYRFTGDAGARLWGERLARQYVRARHPETGLGVYQYSKPRRQRQPPEVMSTGEHTYSSYGDRAENQFASEYGDVAREGWVLWGGRTRSIYVCNALVQLEIAETLGDQGGANYLEWTVSGMQAFLEHAYDPEKNHFRPMWADGADLTGRSITNYGYYNTSGREVPFPSTRADFGFLVAYARAWRLSRDPALWKGLRRMAEANGLGDPGPDPQAPPTPDLETRVAHPEAIFAVLELHRAHPHDVWLALARRLADNLIAQRFHQGFFLPSADHVHANFNAVEPLAILAVDAALREAHDAIPAYIASRGYIHGQFEGQGRTYDSNAIWAARRE